MISPKPFTIGKKICSQLNPHKYTIKQAAEAAIRAENNPFRREYLDVTLLHGMAPNRIKLTIARDMLATMWVMWEKGEKYNPEIKEKATRKQGQTVCCFEVNRFGL